MNITQEILTDKALQKKIEELVNRNSSRQELLDDFWLHLEEFVSIPSDIPNFKEYAKAETEFFLSQDTIAAGEYCFDDKDFITLLIRRLYRLPEKIRNAEHPIKSRVKRFIQQRLLLQKPRIPGPFNV